MNELTLFDVPVTGEKKKQAKEPGLKINRVNRDVAKKRYYWHRQLDDHFKVIAAKREIKTDYTSFEDIPRGKQRYAVSQLIDMYYTIQFKTFK